MADGETEGMTETETDTSAQTETNEVRPKADGRSRTSSANGAKGGAPARPFPWDFDETVDRFALAAAEQEHLGVPLRTNRLLKPLTHEHRDLLHRAIGATPETFNVRVSEALQIIEVKVLGRISQKLNADLFRPHELSFLLCAVEDKRARLDGRGQMTSSVNVQINNFANKEASREAVMSALRGLRTDRGIQEVQSDAVI